MKEIANATERTTISEDRNPGMKYVDNSQETETQMKENTNTTKRLTMSKD